MNCDSAISFPSEKGKIQLIIYLGFLSIASFQFLVLPPQDCQSLVPRLNTGPQVVIVKFQLAVHFSQTRDAELGFDKVLLSFRQTFLERLRRGGESVTLCPPLFITIWAFQVSGH